MKRVFVLILVLLCLPARSEQSETNQLPAVAKNALNSPESVVLYSLEPYTENPEADRQWKGDKFHGYNCLGRMTLTGAQRQMAISEFRKAIPQERMPMANCFDPRHALRIVSGAHTYDFLLCFQCAQMEVSEDDKELATLSATGSADVLNDMLKKAGIPVSYVFSDAYIKQEKAESEANEAAWKKWVVATPESLRPFFLKPESAGITFGNDPEKELAKQIPDENKRILVLLAWYGSGAGPWSGFPSYEELPDELLETYPTEKILAVIQGKALSEAELEGTARFFAGWDRSKDMKLMPAALKRALLEHALKTTDTDKIERAKKAFQ